jgi:hypothetical protein
MDRLIGLRSFATTTVVVLAVIRVLHVGVPLIFPDTRPGPAPVASLDDVQRRVGFAPLLPAYRPAALGAKPASITVSFRPRPTFAIVWRGDGQYLSLTERQGGDRPEAPPISQPLDGVADSAWWMEGSQCHLVLAHGGLWIEIDTDLPSRDLKRLADTLTRY